MTFKGFDGSFSNEFIFTSMHSLPNTNAVNETQTEANTLRFMAGISIVLLPLSMLCPSVVFSISQTKLETLSS